MPIQTHNPATGDIEQTFDELSDGEITNKIEIANTAFHSWKKTSFAERATLFQSLAKMLKANAREIGMLATKEMGKPISQAIAEVEKCAWVCEHYAEHAETYLKDETFETEAQEAYVRHEPLGTLLLVMPWNYPFWQVLRVAAPALMAGNVAVLKHASNVPQSALKIEEMFLEAGFPEGVFQTLMIGSGKVERVVRDPIIKAVSLTGSEKAGGLVASVAAKEIKKSVLELGGSDPFIVFPDADLAFTCETAIKARLQNNGQSCIAAKRFIVFEEVAEEFTKRYLEILKNKKVGDPTQDDTDIGPFVSMRALEEIEGQVNESVAQGAIVLAGGKRMEGPGAFFEPTLLGNVKKGMPVYDQEVFGHVASIITVSSEEEAIQVANDSEFGLGASLWTRDMERAKRIIPQLDTGSVFVNSMVKSDPRLPIGGIKKSGFGRELGPHGIKEFVNVKTIWIQ